MHIIAVNQCSFTHMHRPLRANTSKMGHIFSNSLACLHSYSNVHYGKKHFISVRNAFDHQIRWNWWICSWIQVRWANCRMSHNNKTQTHIHQLYVLSESVNSYANTTVYESTHEIISFVYIYHVTQRKMSKTESARMHVIATTVDETNYWPIIHPKSKKCASWITRIEQ